MLIPIWVYFVAAGILLSAYMAIRAGREERQVENESIELEGRVYMERIEKEREVRKSGEHSIG
ncbi:sporulation YhaL family protein [Bacillus sp. FJAT-49705]|uniref:Sporulation YhaL family protein n=1 Tax=Cytobacillus citreus TaxID=2833586 RepID=A0ABS5NLS9_9BACI|nr:sporulation YhaL family protein [Cytobacillus citreus]MBS4188767.1 sporulation YhaL family protein [Cytobacillus citreus]